ncbi:MAG: SSU ribosomal protein S13p (S18e) [Candidatus Woesebacteria bacterium]|jgi:small subunit ribosomal protein S13|nr:MAG: SSU ribosomal protein S13p (S18e) [Candidatus Woesebacteria bacterium]
MARIVGVELNDNWKIGFALTRINGIGWPTSKLILSKLGIKENIALKDLKPEELKNIVAEVEKYPVEGDLVRKVRADISRLKQIGSYRGMRHSRSLPVRGQRTRRNARTKRGKRKTIGAFKKEALAKMQKAKEEK